MTEALEDLTVFRILAHQPSVLIASDRIVVVGHEASVSTKCLLPRMGCAISIVMYSNPALLTFTAHRTGFFIRPAISSRIRLILVIRISW